VKYGAEWDQWTTKQIKGPYGVILWKSISGEKGFHQLLKI